MLASVLAAATAVVTPWQHGASLNCSADSSNALEAAARQAVAEGKVLSTSGRCIGIGRTFKPPARLRWLGDFDPEHAVVWLGGADVDAVEITTPIDVDGIVLNANRPTSVPRRGLAVSRPGCPFGVHGPIGPGASYLTGVKIGRISVRHTQARAAICIANVSGLSAKLLNVQDSWGAGVILSGMRDSQIGSIVTADVGGLQAEGSRIGQAVSIFTEADPRKRPALWYNLSAGSAPGVILPTENLNIDQIQSHGNTDTTVYLHDYPGDAGTGVHNVSIGQIHADLVGKDLFKVRVGVSNVKVGQIVGERIGAGIVAIEEGAKSVFIGRVVGSDFQYDAVGTLIGLPSPFNPVRTAVGVGAGLTLSTNTVAVRVRNAKNVSIGSLQLRRLGFRLDGAAASAVDVRASSRIRIGVDTDIGRVDIACPKSVPLRSSVLGCL